MITLQPTSREMRIPFTSDISYFNTSVLDNKIFEYLYKTRDDVSMNECCKATKCRVPGMHVYTQCLFRCISCKANKGDETY